MSLKETIIESLGLVEIEKGGTVRNGQTFYTIYSYEGTGEAYEGMGSLSVDKRIASKDFDVRLSGFYREPINIDNLNPGSVVRSSEEVFFVVTVYGVKCFVNSSNYIYSPAEIEIDEVIYYA